MTEPTTLPEALTEIEELRGQVRELLRLLGQEAPRDAGAAGGPPAMFATQASAVIERNQAEREQAQASAELHNVIETIPDVIFRLDLRGNLAGWNKRFETVTGFVPGELNGRPALSFVPEHEHEKTAAAILRAMEEGYAELEGHLLTKDQRAIPYHWTGASLKNDGGQVIGITGVGRDVSERKRIEAELRRQQQHFLAAQAMAHVGSWDWDILSGAMEWSEEQFRIFGYEPGTIPATCKLFLAALLPDDHDRVVASINDTLEGKTLLDVECRIVRLDGEIRTVHCRGEISRSAAGSPVRLFGCMLDITDRKEAELALRQSEGHFRALIENSSDIITVLDLDGTIRFESPSFERLLGYAQHEIDGLIAFDFIHPDDLPAVLERFQLIVQRPGETQIAEFRFRHKDGSWRSFEGVGRAACDSHGRPCVIANSRDITERKQADVLLRFSQEKLRQALRASNTGLWDWNTETNEVSFSREWKRQLGYDEDDLPDVFETWESRLHSEDRARAVAYVQGYLAHPEGEYRQEFRLWHKDGNYRWIEARASFITEPDGRRVRLLGSHTDITERKRAESALRDSEERYRTLVDLSPNGVFVYCSGKKVYVNQAACMILGAASTEQLIEDPAVHFSHPDSYESVHTSLAQILATGTPVRRVERKYRRLDGTEIAVEVDAGRITWNGEPAVQVIFADITERKRAEFALQESDKRFNFAVEATNDGIWDWDMRTGAVYFSPQWMRLLGYSSDEVTPSTEFFFAIVHPDDRARTAQVLQEHLDGRIPVKQLEIRLRQKSGDYRWYLDRGKVVVRDHDGSPLRMVGTITDITERKVIEDRLRTTQYAVDHASDQIFLIDSNGYFLDVNESACRRLGYSKQELLTMSVMDIDPDFPSTVWTDFWEKFKQTKQIHLETRHRSKSGETYPVEVVANFHRHNGQELDCAIVRDLTERKWLELREQERLDCMIRFQGVQLHLDRQSHHDLSQDFRRILRVAAETLTVERVGLWLFNDDHSALICRELYQLSLGTYESGAILEASRYPRYFHALEHDLPIAAQDALTDSRTSEFAESYLFPLGIASMMDVAVRRDGEIIGVVCFEEIGLKTEWSAEEQTFAASIADHVALCFADEEGRHAEQALRRSERKLTEAQRIAHIGSWELDLTTNRLEWSDEIYRIFEIERTGFGASYEAFLSLVHPDDRSTVDRAYSDSVRTKCPYELVHRLLMPDGRVKYVRECCETVYDAQGMPERSFGTVQDVTEYRLLAQREAARIKQLKKLYELSMMLSGDPAVIFNHAVRMIGELFGVRVVCLSQIVGQELHFKAVYIDGHVVADAGHCPLDITPCATVELSKKLQTFNRVMERFPQASFLRDHQATSYCGFPSLDSAGRVVAVTCLLDDKPREFTDEEQDLLRICGQRIATEIERHRHLAEQQRAADELRRSHAFMRQVIDTDPNFIFAKDWEGRFTLANNAVARAYGTTVENLIGKTDADFNPNSREVEFFHKKDIEVLNSREDRFVLEEPITDAQGRTRWLQTIKRPLLDDQGLATMVLGASTDITERKRMEEALRQREQDLCRAIEERERISQDLHDGILQSLYAIGLGLEVCKPLIAQRHKSAPGKLAEALDQTIGQLNHVMAEIRNFIEGLESHVMQGGDFTKALEMMAQATSASSSTVCRLSIQDAAVQHISTERAFHMLNIVREAVSNSLRHGRAKRTTVSLKLLTRSIRLSVSDDGVGFNQTRVHGRGHGLVNMAARARKLGGQFAVRSKPGRGTKVLFDLPKEVPNVRY